MRIAIFGTYPPPIGGTSIHVKRLAKLLQKYYDVIVYDTYGEANLRDDKVISIKNYKRFLVKYIFCCKDDIIHSHTHSWNERFILTLISLIRRKKIIFTYHSLREEYINLSTIEKFSMKFVFKYAELHIVVNSYIRDKLTAWGLRKDKVKIVPAFLLPESHNEELQKDAEAMRKKHTHILCANASDNCKYKGSDLYGLDMCIELCYELRKKYDVGFIFALTKISDIRYYESLQKRIKDLHVEDSFLILNKNISFLAVLQNADIFIRPTNTDGFALSVSEALFYKLPVVASDVCLRPQGTTLFKNRDIKDLISKTTFILDNYNVKRRELGNIEVEDYSKELLEIYQDFQKLIEH
jgi:glycosyltransferase involved in cell wall biosynthesis